MFVIVSYTGGTGQLELAMRCGKVRRLHPIALNEDGIVIHLRMSVWLVWFNVHVCVCVCVCVFIHAGSPVFPIVVGGLKVHNLGKVSTVQQLHS